MRGDHVEARELRDAIRVVERHAKRGAPAAVVAAEKKLVEPEMAHDIDVVLRHAPVRVVAVVRQAARLAAVAVAAQIGAHDRVVFCQAWRDEVPVHVGKRIAVEQQQGRAVAADDAVDLHLRVAGLDVEFPEALEHCQLLENRRMNAENAEATAPALQRQGALPSRCRLYVGADTNVTGR